MKYPYQSALLVSLFLIGLAGSAQAQVQAGAIPEFVPTSPWVIGETGLTNVRGISGMKLPCMMVNQFDNGFVMRLAGGNHQLTAMAIDFRQEIFTRGARYGAAVYTDAGFRGTLQGTAFNAATLIFNLRDVGDFYGALKSARMLGLSIGSNDMRFSLNNAGQGLDRLEACYGGNGPGQSAQQAAASFSQSAPAQAPITSAPADFSEQPSSLADIQARSSGESRTAGREVYLKRGEKIPQGVASSRMGASPAMTPMGNAVGGVWSAQAGESVQGALSRWANQAGVELDWKASGGGQVVQDFTHQGSFESAVGALLSENAAASGLQSRFDNGTSPRARAPSYVSDAPTPLAAQPAAASARGPGADYAANGRWMAPRGGSLQAVLQQWTAQQGVELLWYANSGYTVKDNINEGGSFESALQSLLQTYESDSNRPVARLNTDPGSGRKVLVIESDRVL